MLCEWPVLCSGWVLALTSSSPPIPFQQDPGQLVANGSRDERRQAFDGTDVHLRL